MLDNDEHHRAPTTAEPAPARTTGPPDRGRTGARSAPEPDPPHAGEEGGQEGRQGAGPQDRREEVGSTKKTTKRSQEDRQEDRQDRRA